MGAGGVGCDVVKEMCKEDWRREGGFVGVRISGRAHVQSGLKPWWRGTGVEWECVKMGKGRRRQGSIHTKVEGVG